jgi:hypothetical protein
MCVYVTEHDRRNWLNIFMPVVGIVMECHGTVRIDFIAFFSAKKHQHGSMVPFINDAFDCPKHFLKRQYDIGAKGRVWTQTA